MNPLEDKISAHATSAEKVWGLAYGKFPKVIANKKLKRGSEVGVAFGGHSEAILENTNIQHLYGIDPYRHIKGYDDPMNLPQKEFNALFRYVEKRMARFGNRYTHLRKTSDEAAEMIDEMLDFVYIDADHSYKGVWDDLVTWYPKIRENGVIGGHDYDHVNFAGVKQAIDEFFRRFGWKIHEEGEGVWWTEKKPHHISYIMPAYNTEETIRLSVESIFNGNFRAGDELIIVDDYSSDGTVKIIEDLQKHHKQIKLIKHRANKGGGAARNTAVESAKHNLIFCLDSDNILVSGAVPKLQDFLVSSGADIASFGSIKYFKDEPSNVTHQWHYEPYDASREGALSVIKFPGASGNYLYTKESWLRAGRYPEFAGALDTWGFGFWQVASGSKMKIMPKSFYYHRYGHDSYWIRESRQDMTSLRALQLLLPFIDQLVEDDVDYIMGPDSRKNWFDNIEKHPIKFRDGSANQPSEELQDTNDRIKNNRWRRNIFRVSK